MIEHLEIKNAALIKNASVDFGRGLNIISGETGAGKSMVIDAVKFMLGGRASKDFIRLSEDKAVVSGLFVVENEALRTKIIQAGIEIEEDNSLLIERTITDAGKNTIKINAKGVNLTILKDISHFLMDIHGQHDHQSLLNQSKHLEILDSFCPAELNELKRTLADFLREYKSLSKKAADITAKRGKAGEKLESLRYEIDEIEKAALEPSEEESLNDRLKTLQLSEKLRENTQRSVNILQGDESVISALNQVLRLVSENGDIDKAAIPLREELTSISISLSEFGRDLAAYNDSLDGSGSELAEIEARLELIYILKRKYGQSVEEILAYLDKAAEDYEAYAGGEEVLKKINGRRKELNKEITETCALLHALRLKQAKVIEGQIEEVLKELEMADAKFKISVEEKKEFGVNGNDNVGFLISPNLGEPLKELAKIASGGEMSRIMLALKCVISNADNTGTFIFDEIDAGVSGRTAQKVAQKLDFIGKNQQIICITHLPQIAAMADNHVLIEKIAKNERTETVIENLDRDGQIKEIARLLGGVKITGGTVQNATEMKELAEGYKK
ncbi:MAG: DNA repair protein RecN [Defluviitaleaceae bacterium]|nr:DNA repair protein RecN [Defluviitaleaceae bacterium]